MITIIFCRLIDMQGVQGDSGSYSSSVEVDDGLMGQTGDSSHSGRSVAVISPSSLQPEVPPPPYSELFPVSLPSYWEATGERRVFARCTMTQLANMRAIVEGRVRLPILVSPPELAHRRIECLNDAFCRRLLEGLARNWHLVLLVASLCFLVCVLIVILVKVFTPSAP